jgi:hypothetical protein
MNIEEKETLAAERVVQTAYGRALSYSKHEDLQATTVALLWAAFELEAKRFGLTDWRGLSLK